MKRASLNFAGAMVADSLSGRVLVSASSGRDVYCPAALPAEVKTVSAEGEVHYRRDPRSRSSCRIVLRPTTKSLYSISSGFWSVLLCSRESLRPWCRTSGRIRKPLLTWRPRCWRQALISTRPKALCEHACGLAEDPPKPIPISRVGISGLGAAELVLGLPSDPFSWFDWRRGRTAGLAVADTAGRYVGVGQFVYPSRSWALVLATGITLLLFLGLLWVRAADKTVWKIWCMGLFLGEDGQPSLSLFQILLWTVVTVWALLFVFFCTGNLIAMTQQVMVLLGFAGAGSLAARWVATSRAMAPQRSSDRRT